MGEVKMDGLSVDELDELIEFYQGIEERFDWKEAVRILAAFGPDPAVVRQVEHRAYFRATEERLEGKFDEAGRLTDTGDALAVLAERAEKTRKDSGCRCCIDNECECVNGEDEPEVDNHPAEVFAPEPWELGPESLEMPSYGS